MASFNPDAIPDISVVREGLLERLERHRYLILGGLAVAVFGSLGLLAWSSLRRERLDALHAELYAALAGDESSGRAMFSPSPEDVKTSIPALESVRERARGTSVEPMVLFHLSQRKMLAGDDAGALAVAKELRDSHPDAPIVQLRMADADKVSVLGKIEQFSSSRKDFAARYTKERPAPDQVYTARVETDLGEMKIVFFREQAPRHAEAFLEQARKGAFNGTGFYLLRPGEWLEGGGSAYTRDSDPANDAEDDPALSLAPEDARFDIKHTRGTVTAVSLLSGEQSDRFAIVLQEKREEFDGVRTPFAELLDAPSREIADRIAAQQTYSQDAMYAGDRKASAFPYAPSRPVRIRRISVWKEGVLDAGHTWDTSRVGTDVPEPAAE
jgi:cyclophilin family peptidyl-prolyl cis-trans isomerase